MTRRELYRSIWGMSAALLLIVVGGLGLTFTAPNAIAQGGVTPENGGTLFLGPIYVFRAEPRLITEGKGGNVTVYGANFNVQTRIRLIGFGVVETTLANSGVLIGRVPENIPQGQYGIEVIDPLGGTVLSPDPLIIMPAPTTPTPPPTLVPGQPVLVLGAYTITPEFIKPGEKVAITFEVLNQGNRTARGVFINVETGGKFLPAAGQASAQVGNIAVGKSATTTLAAIAAGDTPSGPSPIPLTISFFDAEGKTYSSKVSVSVNVEKVVQASQITLKSYAVEPNPAIPGKPIALRLNLENTGNDTARQVLLRVAGDNSVLLAGPQGNTFSLGDLAAGASQSLVLPMVVSNIAKAGAQAQPLVISSVVGDKTIETATSVTLNVAPVVVDRPLLLIKSYTLNPESLAPGDIFTLELEIQNVGASAADETLLTFGTVTDNVPNATPDGSGGGGGRSVSGGEVFAPYGTGGSLYVGTIESNSTTPKIVQRFIVNGTATSNVYNLSITLNYIRRSDGAAVQDVLRAAVVVVAPPALQYRLQNALPATVNVGEPLPVTLEIINTGDKRVTLVEGELRAENGEISGEAKTALNNLNPSEDTAVSGTVLPTNEGVLKIVFVVSYIDELRQQKTTSVTFETQAIAVTPPPTEETPPPPIDDLTPTPTPTPSQNDLLRRLLLGLLGLGS